MRILLDTSALVAAMVAAHPAHAASARWLGSARAGEHELVVAAHSLAELYAVLTRLPLRPAIAPDVARELIDENLDAPARRVALSAADYGLVLRRMAKLGLPGGLVYDALIARVAERRAVERLVTLNPGHFRRVWPQGAAVIAEP